MQVSSSKQNLRFGIVTLFPEFFSSPLQSSVIARAIENALITVDFEQIRDHAHDKHRRVDDAPFGGGCGQVMMAGPIVEAIEAIQKRCPDPSLVIYLSPTGKRLEQSDFRRLSDYQSLILVCGHYEGIDERAKAYVDEEISIGDFVLTGGEPAALILIDGISRLRDGVLGNASSAQEESFSSNRLEYPQYTRPWDFRGASPPEILRSGNHGAIAKWREEESLKITAKRRPDLLRRDS